MSIAPFGSAVVPAVYAITATSSSPAWVWGGSPARVSASSSDTVPAGAGGPPITITVSRLGTSGRTSSNPGRYSSSVTAARAPASARIEPSSTGVSITFNGQAIAPARIVP